MALEILERSHGVIVNHQSNLIFMNGKDRVELMINSKMSHVPFATVVEMLSGMSSANIEKIALIATPAEALLSQEMHAKSILY